MASFPSRATAVSYLRHDDSQSESMKGKASSVTVASTILDQQGVVKTVIHPRFVHPFPMIFCPYLSRTIAEQRSEQRLVPVRSPTQRTKSNVDRRMSLLFFWSMPLRAQFSQLCTRPTRIDDLSTRFERHPVKISIGIQNGSERSEIALSHTDETLDSLSYNRVVNDQIIPIGILKKKKFDEDEWNSKRICSDSNVSWGDETLMRNQILANVNLCVDHLSKLLGETCSKRFATNNNYQPSSSQVLHTNEDHRDVTSFLSFPFRSFPMINSRSTTIDCC